MTKNRYQELKYFVRQYDEYKLRLKRIESGSHGAEIMQGIKNGWPSDYVSKMASDATYLKRRIDIIERAAKGCDMEIGDFILKAASRGYSFTKMKMIFDLPCERDMYYDRRKKFYILLDQEM